jgi:hypothetical protein
LNTGQFAKDVEGVEHFLEVHQRHFKWEALPLDLDLQSGRGVAMASAGVKEDKIDPLSFFSQARHSVCHSPSHLTVR